ncbi:DUF3027 domain-containing protein [Corynebacterium variabile]|uniref:DUF3027 domain-containing protein n=4 Tax=Corynebacterium variabile TaxID=1727 RepID=UPI0028A63ABE|nr:DUF3027 domain-containing protein [Corynebacterium variabile]
MSSRGHQGRPSHDRTRRGRGVLLSAQGISTAREAVLDVAGPDGVGEHLGGSSTSPETAVHRFACKERGYRGWEWIAVVACPPGADYVTVNEVALHAGDRALSAPAWVPYEDRVRPGDLQPGDQLPLKVDDPRVVDEDDLVDDDGVRRNPGTMRTLSHAGWDAAVRRWITGDTGPDSEFARRAERTCASCAFWLPLQRRRRTEVGVCSNEYSADGRVVAADYGCGAHSDTPRDEGEGAASHSAWDDGGPERF